MSKETMKLALEALEKIAAYRPLTFAECSDAEAVMRIAENAIPYLREALAKPDFWEGYVPEPDSTCNNTLRAQGKAYPRTCKKCGKGPCVGLAQQALDKKAENARELGLDYEPQRWAVFCQGCRKEWSVSYPHPGKSICADCDDKLAQYSGIVSDGGLDPRNKFDKSAQDSGVVTAGGFNPRTQRTWVGLADDEIYSVLENLQVMYNRPPTTDSRIIFARAIEAKLKEKNQ